ncbi:MAG: hypothetical protein AVDCRST_MAG89-4422, partial [uncultured Gemmatimonadetes bacterium]
GLEGGAGVHARRLPTHGSRSLVLH